MEDNKANTEAEEEQISKILAGASDDENDSKAELEEHHHEDTEDHTISEDFSGLNKEEIAAKAKDFVHYPHMSKANSIFQQLRNYLDEILRKERETLIAQWVSDGNEARDFTAPADDSKNLFYQHFQKFQDLRKEERIKAQQEREKNLHAKEDILQRIKDLVEKEETEGSLSDLRELQREWKQIRQVPREQMTHLWETYRYYLDRFYDNLTMNNELKELDRQKNLEIKIELCLKVDQLKEEKNVKKALILLNKYHDEYKNTGPVPKEATEEIWIRFKAISDEVLNLKKERLNTLKEDRKNNLIQKVLLCEKVEQIAEIPYDKASDWNKKTNEISEIFDAWKKTGPAPASQNDTIWKRFRDGRDAFYKQKKKFFAGLNEQRDGNLILKEDLCKKAEEMMNSSDWSSTTKALIALQKEWKEIGPVPEKVSGAIWKRFRTACDHFFTAKDDAFKDQKKEEIENFNNKLAIINEVKALVETGSEDTVLENLKALNTQWNAIGFVPFKKKDKLYKDYQSATDEVYKKFKKNKDEMRGARMRDHYNELGSHPQAEQKLKDELRRVGGKIRFLRDELKTIENNIAFFSNSKGSEKLLKPFLDKIANTTALIKKLEEEKKYISSQISKANGS